MHRALEAAETLAAEGIDCEVIDLRTIVPLDVEAVAASVAKTHRLLVVDEGWAMCGIGAELGQAIGELAFDQLDAPVARLHTEPVTHPFAPALERAILVDTPGIVEAARGLVAGRAPVPRHWRAPAREARREDAGPTRPASPPPQSAPPPPVRPSRASVQPSPLPADGEAIVMPFGDLTVSEGKIVRWAKAEGDRVKLGELVAEIETDKAVVEIEAPAAGILARIEQPVGATVAMGGRIGVVRKTG